MLIFTIASPDTRLEQSSDFMASSFSKYRWKESLLWVLLRMTPELTVNPVTEIFVDPHQSPEEGIPDTSMFLCFLDQSRSIPFTSNPHSAFVFSSLQNFVAGVYDTINANWLLAGHPSVSLTAHLHVPLSRS
jgi:hypothetical protein